MPILVSFRDARVGGRVSSARIDRSDQQILSGLSEVTILIHGYNTSQDEGLARLRTFALRMNSAISTLAVLWPGDAKVGGLSFPVEGQDADATAVELDKFIRLIWPRGVTLNFVSHSLGARVVMKTIDRLRTSRSRVDNVCLMAAAIDDDKLANHREYYKAAESSNRVVVLHSRKDDTLRNLYRIGDFFEAFLYKEKAGHALGYSGPRPKGVPETVLSVEIPADMEQRHGDYLKDRNGDSSRTESCARFARLVVEGAPWPISFG